jgi:hypothetical protein
MKTIKYFAFLLVLAASLNSCVVHRAGWVPGHYNEHPNGTRTWIPGHYN